MTIKIRLRWFVLWGLLLPLAALSVWAGWPKGRMIEPLGLLPGDFESHDGLLVAFHKELRTEDRHVIAEIASAASRSMDVFVLMDRETLDSEFFDQPTSVFNGQHPHIHLIPSQISVPWTRDFGPLVVKLPTGGYGMVDSDYGNALADSIPKELSNAFRLTHLPLPLALEGGNLLSNGAGLCITSTKIIKENARIHGYRRADITSLLRRHLGARKVVYLEPLLGETTQHVDVFAVFTAPDSIVIGEIDPRHDPINAAILERNVDQLRSLQTACGPLRVSRVPMPSQHNGLWRTYTSVVFANGTLLIPHYPSAAAQEEAALRVYRRLLPGWELRTINATSLLWEGAGLHCVAMNLYRTRPHEAGIAGSNRP